MISKTKVVINPIITDLTSKLGKLSKILQHSLVFAVFFIFSMNSLASQTVISGTVNSTVQIISITDPACSECDASPACRYTIEVQDASNFSAGDRVLIVQMKGATISTTNDATAGQITDIGNAGNYEFFIVGAVDYANNYIYPRGKLKRTYDYAGLMQLVKVPTYTGNVEVNSDLIAEDWDPVAGKGGIVSIFVEDTLFLNADIDVHGKGYQGIEVTVNGSPDNCGINPATQMVKASTSTDVSPKGHGIVVHDAATDGGRGPRGNGGGGGVSGDSGGGGGANYGAGGNGGSRWCNDVDDGAAYVPGGGLGGYPLDSYIALNRIYFGGAGGAGFITNSNAADASNGGGLVVISAKHIVANNITIDAAGESVATPTGGIDGGGGGGGGGTVCFEIQSFSGTLNIDVSGGDGQDLATSTLHGPGGGGGGGAFLYNLAALPSGITVDATGGEGGVHSNGRRNDSKDGTEGGVVSYFNLVYSEEDADGDNISDFCDLDTDNDGILDSDEDGESGFDPSKDADGDGTPNYKDSDDLTASFPAWVDTNGDGVNDIYDRDKDHIPDFQDLDSDNDGIVDAVEAGGIADATGAHQNYVDTDLDGLNDEVDPDNGGTALVPIDSDGDGAYNFIDVDSDNDGVSDSYESTTSTIATGIDNDDDGIDNAFDVDESNSFNTPIDHDGDGYYDMYDIDSDNDGIADYYETSGIAPSGVDADSDGLDDAYDVDFTAGTDANGDWIDDNSIPIDTDTDGLYNIYDIDSDSDGIVDNIEGQSTAGYIAPLGSDTDGDGLDNAYDTDNSGTTIVPVDTDNDSEPDFLDTNSDEDPETDLVEAYDTDADGVSNTLPAGSDSDSDGLDDNFDNTVGKDATDGGKLATDYPDVDNPGGDRDWRQNLPIVTLSLDKPILAENGQTATFTVAMNQTTYADVTITLSYTGSAIGADYNAAAGVNASNSTTIVIPAGQLSGTVTVTTVDDASVESAETIIVDIQSVSNAKEDDVQQKIVTISDNDAPGITVSAISNPTNEDGQTATFTIVLNSAPSANVTISYASNNTSESTLSSSVTFTNGDWSIPQTVTVTPVDDNIYEQDVNFSIVTNAATSSDGDYSGLNADDVAVVNQDDDLPPTISIDNSSGTEGSNITFTVNLSNPSHEDITATLDLTNGTAGSGDYTTNDVSVTISAGTTSNTVLVPTTGDTTDEPNEIFTIGIKSIDAGTVDADISDEATGTINDNDVAPSFSINDVSVAEGNSGTTNLTFTIALSAASGKATSVDYATANNTATTADGDYNAISTTTLNFAVGETSKTIDVVINGDTKDEINETLYVNLSNAVNATISDNQGEGTINDDDVAPSFSINDVSVAEGNAGTTNLTFTVTLSAVSGKATSVDYVTENNTATTADGDYNAISTTTLNFAAGETSKTFDVTINGDTKDEVNETLYVNLSNAVNATISDNQGEGTVTDDDAAPSFSIDDVSVSEGNSGTTNLTFTITLSAASGKATSVDYATANNTATTADGDYDAITSTTLNFAIGETSKTINVTINGDNKDEINETLYVNLSNAVNATISDNQGEGTVTDDDVAPSFSINDVSVAEGNAGTTNLTFTVTLSAVSGKATSVDYATANNTATTADGDYNVISTTTLNFAAGETSKTIDVVINGDAKDEIDETLYVNLSNAVNASISDTQGEGTVTDDDASPSFSINDVSVAEGNAGTTNLTFTVTLSSASGKATSVDYATANNTATTADGDYNAITTTTLNFAVGETSKTIDVTINGDVVDEANETLYVNLSNAVNATISDNQGEGTVTDDDIAPSFSINDVDVAEGNAGTTNLTFTVTLSAASGQATSVDYATANNTATTADGDYDAITSTTLNFAVGETSKTINVTINGDTKDEVNETLYVNLSNAVNATISDSQGEGTINDDDVAPSFSIDDVSVVEGSLGTTNLTFTVTLSAVSGKSTSVDYATANNTATTADGDYNAITSTTLNFSAGETSKTIDVTINSDTKDEVNETLYVNLNNAVNATISDNQGEGTITDDDGPPGFLINDVSATEGNSGTTNLEFTISLTSASGVATSVDYATADNTATLANSDYVQATATTINFAIGETSKTINIAITGDEVDEGDETLYVNLTNAVSADILDSQGEGTITDDDETPDIVDDAASIPEDSGNGDLAYNVNDNGTSNDTDADTDAIEYSITSGNDEGIFEINATTGAITVKDSTKLDYETTTSYSLVVLADDKKGNTDNATITINIANADSDIEITVADNSALETEGSTTITFTISTNLNTAADLDVEYTTAGVTALEGTDYDDATGTATILAGTNSVDVSVTINGDTNDEPDETFTLTLSNPEKGSITDSEAIGTITDDDGPPAFLIDDVSVAEGNSGISTLIFTISLTNASGVATSVDYSTADNTATLANSDYVQINATTLNFAAGETSKTVDITVNADEVDEVDEVLYVNLTNSVNAGISDSQGEGTITDDDETPNIVDDVASIPEDTGNGDLAYDLNDNGTSNDTDADTDAIEYSITSGNDEGIFAIDASSGEITVVDSTKLDYETTTSYSLVVLADDKKGNTNNATITINITNTDSDLEISVADNSITEAVGGTTINITISTNVNVVSDLDVDYITAAVNATEGVDYDAASGKATILAGTNSVDVQVTINDDLLEETSETFTLTISNATSGSIIDSEATATILDNEIVDTDGDGIPDDTDDDDDNDGTPDTDDPNRIVPTTADDILTTPEGSPGVVNVLGNDDFQPGAGIVLSNEGSGTGTGSISFDNATGELTYVPSTGEEGKNVTVVYTVCNTAVNPNVCENATVNITVTEPLLDTDGDGIPNITDEDDDNDGTDDTDDPNPLIPTAVDIDLTAPEGGESTVNVLSNDDFKPGTGITIVDEETGTGTGTVIFDSTTGEMTYIPAPGEVGKDVTIDYTVCNTSVTPNVCASATVVITVVEKLNNAPSAADDVVSISTDETSASGNVSLNDSDEDGDNLTISFGSSNETIKGKYGELDWTTDGKFTYILDNTVPEVMELNGETLTEEFIYVLSDGNGGTTTGTLTITIVEGDDKESVEVDDGFSPNGDGIGDYFTVENIEDYPNNEIIIYNRWGTKIYEKKGYDNSWDGKSKQTGKLLPVGTYFYMLYLEQGGDPIKGNVFMKY